MGQLYRYKNEKGSIIYVGLVYGDTTDHLYNRLDQHKSRDPWAKGCTIETLNIPKEYLPLTRSSTEALETHFINKYYNKELSQNVSQVGRGLVQFIPRELEDAEWVTVPPKPKTKPKRVDKNSICTSAKGNLITKLYTSAGSVRFCTGVKRAIMYLEANNIPYRNTECNETEVHIYSSDLVFKIRDLPPDIADCITGPFHSQSRLITRWGFLNRWTENEKWVFGPMPYQNTGEIYKVIDEAIMEEYGQAMENMQSLERNYPGYNDKSKRAQVALKIISSDMVTEQVKAIENSLRIYHS